MSGADIAKMPRKEPDEMAGFCKFCKARIRPSLVIPAGPGIDPAVLAQLAPDQRAQLQLSMAIHEHLAAHHQDQLRFILLLKESFANLLVMMTIESEHPAISTGIEHLRAQLTQVMLRGPQPAPPKIPTPGEQKAG